MRGGVERIFACAPDLLALNVMPPIVPRIPTTVTPSLMIAIFRLYHKELCGRLAYVPRDREVGEKEKRERVALLLVLTQHRMGCTGLAGDG